MKLVRYYRTLRHLTFNQVFHRLKQRFSHPRPDPSPAPGLRPPSGRWIASPPKTRLVQSGNHLLILNRGYRLDSPAAWHSGQLDKLRFFHLHYFDDLSSEKAPRLRQCHSRLINRWIGENPPARGVGWESYPLSRRIVNWIRWGLDNECPRPILDSLAVQVRYLTKRLEYHLLGNHLLANAKALVFAGLFFEGPEASRWIETGLEILRRQLPKQVLPDGGHFERSPMYHSLALEDLLDLLNISQVYSKSFGNINRERDPSLEWRQTAQTMLTWLGTMSHGDGLISFFNDATHGIAPSLIDLENYSRKIGIASDSIPQSSAAVETVSNDVGSVVHLRSSGFIRLSPQEPIVAPSTEKAVVLMDVGSVGPDHQPGHAHAGTLSFELSLDSKRLLVNSGVSTYEEGLLRSKQRGSAAHNTVVVDELDSSETWGSFRVATRARTFSTNIGCSDDAIVARASHDGYRRLSGKVIHNRSIRLYHYGMEIIDELSGLGEHQVDTYFHLHPNYHCTRIESHTFGLAGIDDQVFATLSLDLSASPNIAPNSYCPEFGVEKISTTILGQWYGQLPLRLLHVVRWDDLSATNSLRT